MKKSWIKIYPVLIIFTAVMVLAASAAADETTTMTGKIVERTALDQKQPDKMGVCPVAKADSRSNAENDFVFLANDGTCYDLPNVPNSVEVRDRGNSVVVTGKVGPGENTIIVDKITEDGHILWCKRKIIHYDNPLYPADIPDLCS